MSAALKTINGRQYAFARLPATKAVELEIKLAQLVGEPLLRSSMDPAKTGANEEEAVLSVVGAVVTALRSLTVTEAIALLKLVFAYVSTDGLGDLTNMDHAFAGRRASEKWEVFGAAVRENLSDFLPDGLWDRFKAATVARISGPATSSSPPT